MRKTQLWLCYCTLAHLPGLELWTSCGRMLPHSSVDRTGVINVACGNGTLPTKHGVLKKITKTRGAQRVLEMLGLGSASWGTARAPERIFPHPYKGRRATVIFPRCLWVVPGDVPSCRWARCCCISQSRWGMLTWFMHSETLWWRAVTSALWARVQCWEGELVWKDRTATELWFMRIWRKTCYFGGQYLIRPISCPFPSTIFSITISLSVLDEYLVENEAGKSH